MVEKRRRPRNAGDARAVLVAARVRKRLDDLDPLVDLETFLVDAARAIVEETGSAACGVVRRFSGAAMDLALLVTATGDPGRKTASLGRSDRHTRLPVPESSDPQPGFLHPMIRELAATRSLDPDSVFVFPVVYGERLLVTLELADPNPKLLASRQPIDRVLDDLAVTFMVAVLQERLRRERLEAQLLHAVGRELGRTFDLDDLLAAILDLLRQVVAFDAAAIYVLDRGGLSAVHQSMRGYEETEKRALAIKLDEGLVGWVARTGEAAAVADVTRDSRYLQARPSTRSEMVVPLKSGGRVIGVFNLESDRPDAYSPHDLELLATFANQAAAAVERARLLEEGESARRLEQELSIARKIQQEFLPDPREPIRAGAISGATIFSTEVSGDYYDFLPRPEGNLALAVADVSGKGMPAALIMSSLRAAFRLSAARLDDPAHVARELNSFLYASLRETEFVTGVFAVVDRTQTVFHYSNAGHNPPLHLRADGSYRWLEKGGVMLGAFQDQHYEGERVALAPGDRIVLYTDGVTEAHPGDHEEFGSERLLGIARALVGKAPREMQAAIIREVKEHVGGPPPDDLTIVVLAGCVAGDA